MRDYKEKLIEDPWTALEGKEGIISLAAEQYLDRLGDVEYRIEIRHIEEGYGQYFIEFDERLLEYEIEIHDAEKTSKDKQIQIMEVEKISGPETSYHNFMESIATVVGFEETEYFRLDETYRFLLED